MVELRSLALVAEKEAREAWRNRWFLLFTAAFVAMALALSWLGVAGVVATGFAGFGRTAASLVNLVILVVPLMGLILGAHAVAGERDRGTLLYLLAQPISPAELVLGKFVGLSVAVLSSLLLGFGLAGMVLAGRQAGGRVAPYLAFLALSGLLAMASVGIGLLVSTLSSRASVASGVCLFAWLVLVFIGDLGLMGTALAMRLGPGEILAGALLNPLQVFKIAALASIRGGVEVLGPAGLVAERTFGGGLTAFLALLLVLWVLVPLAGAMVALGRGDGAAR